MERFDYNTFSTKDLLTIKDGFIHFPERYLELYFIDYLDEIGLSWTCKDGYAFISGNDAVLFRLKCLQISTTHGQYWYDSIVHLTFPSIFMKLKRQEIENLNNKESIHYKTLLDRLNCPFEKIFVRLNSVSPKFCGYFLQSDPKWREKVLDLLYSCPRTKETLDNKFFKHYIMLRQWVEIKPEQEFRCFIYKNRLTAISQYHCYTRYKNLPKVEFIRDSIVAFYQENFASIPYEDCVMDVILETTGKVTIVEFNSFGADGIAGSALFNWEQDREILYSETAVLPVVRILKSQ